MEEREEEEGSKIAEEVEGDEEVDIFSAEDMSINQRQPSFNDRAIVHNAQQCLSKELLEQMPMLSLNVRYEETELSEPFRIFHLMQLIEKSIQVGALFSPRLYAPKEIWQQDQVKMSGIQIKIEAFQQLKQEIEKISMTLPLSSDAAKEAFPKQLDGLNEYLRSQRLVLIRSFPFIPVEKTTCSTKIDQGPNVSGGIGKLTNLAVGFGRMVKKQAIAAVERVGAAPSVTVSFDEIEQYAAVLCSFISSMRSIESLVVELCHGKTKLKLSTVDEITLNKLKDLGIDVLEELASEFSLLEECLSARFFDEVLCELVIRDIQALLETYLRRKTRNFGEFLVDELTSNPPSQQQQLRKTVLTGSSSSFTP